MLGQEGARLGVARLASPIVRLTLSALLFTDDGDALHADSWSVHQQVLSENHVTITPTAYTERRIARAEDLPTPLAV